MIKEGNYYKLHNKYFKDYLFVKSIKDDVLKGLQVSFIPDAINSYFQYDGSFETSVSSLEKWHVVESSKEEFNDALKKIEDLAHGIRTDFIS